MNKEKQSNSTDKACKKVNEYIKDMAKTNAIVYMDSNNDVVRGYPDGKKDVIKKAKR